MEITTLHLGRFAAHTWGQGPQTLLCLHGYGGDGRQFAALFPTAWPGWRIVALDLPFFGGSTWQEAIHSQDLRTLATDLQAHFHLETLHVLGFSLGARLALGLVAHSHLPIRTVILISPDGLRLHPIYRLAVHTAAGRWAFRRLIQAPGFLLFINRTLYKLRIQNPAQYQFVRRQLEEKADRELLYQVWMGYRHWPPSLREVTTAARRQATEWHVIWGKQDRITPPRLGKKFLRHLPETKTYFLEGGHFLLRNPAEKVAELVASIVQQQ